MDNLLNIFKFIGNKVPIYKIEKFYTIHKIKNTPIKLYDNNKFEFISNEFIKKYDFKGETGPYIQTFNKKTLDKTTPIRAYGNMVNGAKDGKWLYFKPNGSKDAIYTFKNDVLHGTSILYNNNGIIQQKNKFVNGKKEGKQITYSISGKQISSISHYKNDKLHGKHINFNPYTGGLEKTIKNYDNGLLHGKYIHYDELGQLSFIEFYNKGQKMRKIYYNPDKTVKSDISY